MRTRGNLSSTIPTNRGPTASSGGFDIGAAVHAGLDVLGMVPILGAIPDLINGGFYALQGDWGNAAFSLAAAVPLAGDVLGAGKLALKYGDDVAAFAANIGGAVGAATTRYRDDAASALTRSADDVAAGAKSGDDVLYHRLESPTQTAADAKAQQSSGELWGKPSRYGSRPQAKAYRGPLPGGTRGVEFTTSAKPDLAGSPGIATWTAPRSGVELRGDYAVICIVVTQNTQC